MSDILRFGVQNYIILINLSFRVAVSNFTHMEKLDILPAHEKMLFVGLSLARTIPTACLKVKIGASLTVHTLMCSEGLLL